MPANESAKATGLSVRIGSTYGGEKLRSTPAAAAGNRGAVGYRFVQKVRDLPMPLSETLHGMRGVVWSRDLHQYPLNRARTPPAFELLTRARDRATRLAAGPAGC